MLDEAEKSKLPVAPGELPPFPAVAIKALQVASSGDGRLRELHDLVCADPVFAGEILRVANSPLYGISARINSTLQASILLGYERLKKLVLTIGIRVYLANALDIPTLRACWRHSLACAVVAEDLASASFVAKSEARAYLDKDAAYTAGIIHDLGRLVLAKLMPKQYADLLKGTKSESCNVLARERELFGIDHCQAGRLLVEAWRLPAEFIEIASGHHDDLCNRPFDALAAVHFSCLMADALGFQVANSIGFRSYEELLSGLPEPERQYFCVRGEEYISKVARRIDLLESL